MVYYFQPYRKQGVHSEKEGVDLDYSNLSNYLKLSKSSVSAFIYYLCRLISLGIIGMSGNKGSFNSVCGCHQ
jgi:hypothetical protein